jgi:hypothetical protein
MTLTTIRCFSCGREQTIAPANVSGGITHEEAEGVGWERRGGTWRCPFCAGNRNKLLAVFDRGAEN